MEPVYKTILKGSRIWSTKNQMHLILTDDVIVQITNSIHGIEDYVYGKPQQLLFHSPWDFPCLINKGQDDWGFSLKNSQDYDVPKSSEFDWSYDITPETVPFSDEIIEKLNQHQNNDMRHPYTCGNDHCKEENRKLIPTTDGLICKCGYKQNWCHKF